MNASDKDLNDLASSPGSFLLGMFLLSRGVYNLKNENLADYRKHTMDITDDAYLPEWMEFDKFYLFKQEDLKKEAKSVMVPFSFLFPISGVKRMFLVDGANFLVKLMADDCCYALQFSNIIECWKFYYYGRILYYNAREFLNSMVHLISLNLRILLDDYRESMVPTVLAAIIGDNNKRENEILAKQNKTFIDEDMINFPGLTKLYERMLIALYSMEDPPSKFPKLKVITDQFHKYYFHFIKELFANPYTDVS